MIVRILVIRKIIFDSKNLSQQLTFGISRGQEITQL